MSGKAGDEYVCEKTGEVKVHLPRKPNLDSEGRELVSSVSLVVGVDLHPLSLGERVKRFMRTPLLQADLDAQYDDLGLEHEWDDDATPMSPHEDRYHDLRARIHARKKKELEEANKKKVAELEAEKDHLRKRIAEIQAESYKVQSPTPAPAPHNAGEQGADD